MKSLVFVIALLEIAASALAGELQDAAARGEIDKVRSLIQANPASINAREGGTTALHEATRAGHLEIVKLLVANGANVNATDFSGLTPLKLALGRRNTEIAELLRQHGGLEKAPALVTRVATITNSPPPRAPLFSTSATTRSMSLPAATVMTDSTRTAPATTAPSIAPTNRPPTEQEMAPVIFPIHEAARIGDVEQIKFLFKNSPDIVDSTDEKGRTPLHVAAANKQFKVAQTLLGLRAKVNARAANGQTPLHVAARQQDAAVAGLLLTNRAIVNVRDSFENTPLLVALESANSETVDNPFLAADKLRQTNSVLTLHEQQFAMVNLLLANRADVNVRNRAGATPLAAAVRVGNEPVVNLLLRAGADSNAAEMPTGVAPLHLAAARGHAGIVQALLRSRATIDALDARGETPLCHALREGRTNTIAVLRQAGGTIGTLPQLSPSEKSLVDFYERTEMALRIGSSSEKSRAVLAMNPAKSDLDRMFPKHTAAAWKIVEELNREIKQTFSRPVRDADMSKEIWRIRPEQPSPVAQEWRSRGWLAPDLPVLSLSVDKTGSTTRPGDFCFVNGHWVLVPPLRTIAVQAAADQAKR
jgi:ankyrin repeat protein